MAYAAALGMLQAKESIDTLHLLLLHTGNEGARMEVALSLARMIGQENQFVSLLRQVRADPGTAAAKVLLQLRQRLARSLPSDALSLLNESSDAFSYDDLAAGSSQLAALIRALPPEGYGDSPALQILQLCADDLDTYGAQRTEMLVLVLHTLSVGLRR